MAQTFGIDYVPHCWGTGIALSAAMQVLCNYDIMPGRMFEANALMELDCTENGLRQKLTTPVVQAVDGMVDVPDNPGLGIEVDEDVVNFYAVKS